MSDSMVKARQDYSATVIFSIGIMLTIITVLALCCTVEHHVVVLGLSPYLSLAFLSLSLSLSLSLTHTHTHTLSLSFSLC